MSDADVMLRVQAGDDGALAVLMARWEVPLKSFIGRIVLNRDEAEDLAQESFVRVWQQRNKFRAGAEFHPWLFAIAVNLARNRLRWWRSRPTVSLDGWTNHGPAPAELPEETSASSDALEKAERASAVRDAVATLPTDLREVVVLFEYEHLSHAEIAEIIGASPKAVETRLYRARQKLRSALKPWL